MFLILNLQQETKTIIYKCKCIAEDFSLHFYFHIINIQKYHLLLACNPSLNCFHGYISKFRSCILYDISPNHPQKQVLLLNYIHQIINLKHSKASLILFLKIF